MLNICLAIHVLKKQKRKATISGFGRVMRFTGDGSSKQSTKPLRPLGGIDQLTKKYRTGFGQTCFLPVTISSSWTDNKLKASFHTLVKQFKKYFILLRATFKSMRMEMGS